MKKKYKLLSILMAASVTATATLAGCTLVSSYTQADMQQVIASVDISKSENLSADLAPYAGAINSSTSIYKRDLIAYFLNAGSSLIQGGSTYGQAFRTLSETLVNNEILIQYATLATLKSMVEAGAEGLTSAEAAVEWFNGMEEAERYEALLYFQSETDDEDVDYKLLVEYSLKKALNDVIDGYEERDDEEAEGTSSATVPGGVDTEEENYYPVADGKLDYNVYTGWGDYLLPKSGIYQEDAYEKTTLWSRRQAYNRFIQYLDVNYLLGEDEDIRDVWNLDYVQEEYVTMLRQQVLSNYYDIYRGELEESIDADYVTEKYNEMLIQQTAEYANSSDDFETAMSTMSDTSFLLYAPETIGDSGNKFGYVYNILLPFSSVQEALLADYSSKLENDDGLQNGYYSYRNSLLSAVRTTDQRDDWFNGGEDYSFDASDSGIEFYNANSNILFFENNLLDKNDRYEDLERYLGTYAYNGKAIQNDDDSYTLIPNRLTIDDMLYEFESYLGFVLGEDKVSWNYWADGSEIADANDTALGNAAYYQVNDFYSSETEEGLAPEIDYSKFIYAAGSVNLGDVSAAAIFDKQSDYYRALSAVNELQYAYTTDTGVLSQYVGYSISAYSTDYIKEFEYAAQQAIREGAGSFIVCAGDYGWHLIYVTYVFDGLDVYTDCNFGERMNTEGTFEYEFYQSIKSSELTSATTTLQSNLLQNLYQTDKSVVVFEDRFSDLTSNTAGGSSTSTGSGSSTSGSGSSAA